MVHSQIRAVTPFFPALLLDESGWAHVHAALHSRFRRLFSDDNDKTVLLAPQPSGRAWQVLLPSLSCR
jgi:hypothetical protein